MYCENHLDLFGEHEDIQKFIEENRVKKTGKRLLNQNILTFNKSVKVEDPDNESECKDKWGTKQDADIKEWEEEFDDEEEMDQYYYIFLTPGNPPNKWLKSVAEKYSDLEFNLVYKNSKKNLQGEIVYREGKLYNSTLENVDETIWFYIGEDLTIELQDLTQKLIKSSSLSNVLKEVNKENSKIYNKIKKFISNYDENGHIVLKKGFNVVNEYLKGKLNYIDDNVDTHEDSNGEEMSEDSEEILE